jgi:hypothetical protein
VEKDHKEKEELKEGESGENRLLGKCYTLANS